MNLKSFFLVQFLVLSLFAVSGCKDSSGVTVPDGTDTVVPIDPTNPNNPPTPGVVDNLSGFNVKVKPAAQESYYIHKDGDFTKACAIADTATLPADIDLQCIVEADELEGMFGGIKMVVNVPSGSCDYIVHRPYYFYARNFGDGPTVATVKFYDDGTLATSTLIGPGQVTAKGQVLCNYAYTGEAEQNCCTGTYNLTTVLNFTDPKETTVVQSGIEWGGKPGNCAAGYGADSAPRDKKYNLPMSTIYDVPAGFSETFTVLPSILNRNDSLYFSNFFNGAAPAAFKSASIFPANPYYEWICYDDAKEIKSRISVQVRDWNAYAEFLLKASGNPDTTGTEAAWGTPINDFPDWDDIKVSGDGFPGPNF